jgi:hypothetical protein
MAKTTIQFWSFFFYFMFWGCGLWTLFLCCVCFQKSCRDVILICISIVHIGSSLCNGWMVKNILFKLWNNVIIQNICVYTFCNNSFCHHLNQWSNESCLWRWWSNQFHCLFMLVKANWWLINHICHVHNEPWVV